MVGSENCLCHEALNAMLESCEEGCEAANATHTKLDSLSVEVFRSKGPEYAPVILNDEELEFEVWDDEDGTKYFGTVDKESGEMRGIVRRVYSDGAIEEGQWCENKPHGFFRCCEADGTYYTGCYKEGVFVGEWTYYKEDGDVDYKENHG